jgi:hypothetical protein
MKINPGQKKNRFFMRASGSEFVPGVKKIGMEPQGD